MGNLVQIFFDAVSKYPDHLAILHKNKGISYNQLGGQVRATAAHLKKKGIQKGTNVLVFIPMSIKLYQTVLALFSIGAVVVFVDEWSDFKRLKKAIHIVQVEAIIAPRKYLWLAYLLYPFRRIQHKIYIPNQLPAGDFSLEVMTSKETALVTFTTGSTGVPKAANRTHAFLREQFRILKNEIGAKPDDACLVTLPIVLLSILGTGATGIIADFKPKKADQLYIDRQIDLISERKVSIIIASPYYLENLSKAAFSSIAVRKIITGGAPVFPDLAKKIRSSFGQAECIVAYGSTEAEPISTTPMEEVIVDKNGLKVGRVHPEILCKIIKIINEPISLGEGGWTDWEAEFGEIIVSGPHVLTDYYNSDAAFKWNKIVDDGRIWHRTADSGRLLDGILYLNGRCSQLIKVGINEYKSLFLIEHHLRQIPCVEMGTMVDGTVFVELGRDGSKKEVVETIKGLSLEEKAISILKHLPRDKRHFSKINYEKLKEI